MTEDTQLVERVAWAMAGFRSDIHHDDACALAEAAIREVRAWDRDHGLAPSATPTQEPAEPAAGSQEPST